MKTHLHHFSGFVAQFRSRICELANAKWKKKTRTASWDCWRDKSRERHVDVIMMRERDVSLCVSRSRSRSRSRGRFLMQIFDNMKVNEMKTDTNSKIKIYTNVPVGFVVSAAIIHLSLTSHRIGLIKIEGETQNTKVVWYWSWKKCFCVSFFIFRRLFHIRWVHYVWLAPFFFCSYHHNFCLRRGVNEGNDFVSLGHLRRKKVLAIWFLVRK